MVIRNASECGGGSDGAVGSLRFGVAVRGRSLSSPALAEVDEDRDGEDGDGGDDGGNSCDDELGGGGIGFGVGEVEGGDVGRE